MMHDDPPEPDRVLARLAELENEQPVPELAKKIRAAALERLRPKPLHSAWALLVACSALGYLAGALRFTLGLF
jgi:hypothetical protein